jgi:hypothetical protein
MLKSGLSGGRAGEFTEPGGIWGQVCRIRGYLKLKRDCR